MAFDWEALTQPGGGGFSLPHVQDVGVAVYVPLPASPEGTWFVGSDGSLWIQDTGGFKQRPSPGDLTRVAVAPDRAIWCTDSRGVLWKMVNGSWFQIDVPSENLVIDVDVCADGTAYLLMKNRRYYSISPGGSPRWHPTMLALEAIAGLAGPNESHPVGQAWGVGFGEGVLYRCETVNGWSMTNLRDVREISTDHQGSVWMVKNDGTVWKSTDGATQLRIGNSSGYTRIAACYDFAYAVKSDGSSWVWREVASAAPAPPPPTPPPPPVSPPPGAVRPSISVQSSGSGENSIFAVTGFGFLPNTQVTIRGARIGEGQIHQVYWTTNSNGEGKISASLPIPCVTGIQISFSANDGRPDQGDLTNRFWSNTADAYCR